MELAGFGALFLFLADRPISFPRVCIRSVGCVKREVMTHPFARFTVQCHGSIFRSQAPCCPYCDEQFCFLLENDAFRGGGGGLLFSSSFPTRLPSRLLSAVSNKYVRIYGWDASCILGWEWTDDGWRRCFRAFFSPSSRGASADWFLTAVDGRARQGKVRESMCNGGRDVAREMMYGWDMVLDLMGGGIIPHLSRATDRDQAGEGTEKVPKEGRRLNVRGMRTNRSINPSSHPLFLPFKYHGRSGWKRARRGASRVRGRSICASWLELP